MSADKADYNPNDALLNLKGKAYLPVAARIVWFRNDYPEGQIETTIVSIDEKQAIFRARVATGQGGVAEATGTETPRDFGDYIEKAETKAVGRALGYLGYGTASAGFEEGQRIVDAPQPLTTTPPARTPAPSYAAPQPRTATERPPQAQSPPTPIAQGASPAAATSPTVLDPFVADLAATAWRLVEDGKAIPTVWRVFSERRKALDDAQWTQVTQEWKRLKTALEERDAATAQPSKPASYAG
jgi:hypothetical protein